MTQPGDTKVKNHMEVTRDDDTPQTIEEIDMERASPNESDSGEIETLPDGSISIPVLEEELVVTKRMVVRERIIIRKNACTEEIRVEADLIRERVEIDSATSSDVPFSDVPISEG